MRPHLPIALLALLGITACCTRPETPAEAPAPFDEAGVRAVLAMQEKAWDAGDIPAFMEGYADTACFIVIDGRTCGRAAVTAKYQRSYPTKAHMGDLSFNIHEVLPMLGRLFEVHAQRRISVSLLDTYLGRNTGRRVLEGEIKQGDGRLIHAVIWFCDLRNSTALADQ